MKKNTILYKILYGLNILFAVLLLLTILVKYSSSGFISFFSWLSLLAPLIIAINILFALFWIVLKNRKAFLSVLALLLGFLVLGPFYKLNDTTVMENDTSSKELKILTFNVRGFNKLGQINEPKIDSLIIEFLEKENPDVICMQETNRSLKRHNILQSYKFKYVDFVEGEPKDNVMQAICSKYPILNASSINLPKSYNSALYADILINNDTMRLFSLHLESFKIIPSVRMIQKEDSKRLLGRIQNTVRKQREQAQIVRKEIEQTKYPTLVVGDFNNTQFSNVYHHLKGDMSDTYFEKGSGFGRTYNLRGYPMRIDYVLADDNFEVISHKNYDVELSDHYPVMATLRLKSKE